VETGAGKRGKKRDKELVDRLAAEILLQGWLDTQRAVFSVDDCRIVP